MSSDLFMHKQRQEPRRRRQYSRANARRVTPAASFNGSVNSCSSISSSSTYAVQQQQGKDSCPRAKENGAEDDQDDDDEDDNDGDGDGDAFANLLSLTLKKPKHWKWELTTSRSCTNIALPRILLYDHTGELLIDADSQLEQTYCQRDAAQVPRSRRNSTRKRSSQCSATSSLAPSIRQALDREFTGLHIAEATPSPKLTPVTTPMHSHSYSNSHSPTPSMTTPSSDASSFRQSQLRAPGVGGSCIDFYTNKLPDQVLVQQQFERRSSSLKGVRFMFDHHHHQGKHKSDTIDADNNNNSKNSKNGKNGKNSNNSDQHDQRQQCNYPTPPSTVTTTTTATATPTNSSTSSGPREKRRYRRSHSSGRSPGNSASILERFSLSKGRFSSPEGYAEEQQLQHGPRYYLRTSKAGTLVIQEDSFSRQRLRSRRPKHSSSENVLNENGKSQSANSLPRQTRPLVMALAPVLQAGSRQNVTDMQPRPAVLPGKPLYAVRRHRSDGNVLLQHDSFYPSGNQLAPAPKQTHSCSRAQSACKLFFASPRLQAQPQRADYAKNYAGDLVALDSDKRDYCDGQASTAR